jgi:hypothetical protein
VTVLLKVSYLQLNWPSWCSARNFAALVFRPEVCNHTDVNNYGETQKPDFRVFGICSGADC